MSRFSAQNPDGYYFVGTANGLILIRSPLWTRDWKKDYDLPEEENERLRKAAVDASRERWLETVRGTPAELAWRASNVVRSQPGRATRIGDSRVWLVLMPLPPRASGMDRRGGDDCFGSRFDRQDDLVPPRASGMDRRGGDDCFGSRFDRQDDLGHREPELVLMNGYGQTLTLEDGDFTLRHGHYAAAGDEALGARHRGLREGECMWCGDAVPCGHDHRIHVAGVIGHIDLACRRGGGERSQVVTDAIEAVRGLGAEYAAHVDGITQSLPLVGVGAGATPAATPVDSA